MNRRTSLILKKVESKLFKNKYSISTIRSYTDWIYRFLFFYEAKNIQNYGENEINHFLKFLDNECRMAPSTINQAQNAILFLYRDFWEIPIDNFSFYIKHYQQKPVILNRNEIGNILSILKGEKWLMTALMYGCGITSFECTNFRISNIDFDSEKVIVKNGNKKRQTLFPKSLYLPLKNQIKKVYHIYSENILLKNYGGVRVDDKHIPNKIETSKEFENHFLFPSRYLRLDKKTELLLQHCISESYLQKIFKNIPEKKSDSKKICCSSFRHSFATHLIEEGYDIHMVQELIGHKNLQSTMIYKDLAKIKINNIISPLDKLISI